MSSIEPSLIDLENVSFSYGRKVIFSDATMSVHPGEMISIVGESGSGKSTLLYILGGFLKPVKGEYTFAGKKVYQFAGIGLGRFRRRNIGFLFQDFRLLPFLSIEKNIRFPMFFTGLHLPRNRVKEIMQRLGIFHRRRAFPKDVSGGEMQRTALARALLGEPKLLLLDEPTGNLDEKTEQEILDTLIELKQSGLALVCVTHSSVIRDASDRVFRLKEGKFEEEVPKGRRKVTRRKK